jgi:hypothetical protein
VKRYCAYEPGRFDDNAFSSTPQGFVHEVQPRHYARTGTLVHIPPVDPTAFSVPFTDVLAAMVREASQAPGVQRRESASPEAGGLGRAVQRLTAGLSDQELAALAQDERFREAGKLRLEILRLTDRFSNEELADLIREIRRRLGAPPG